MSTAPHPEARFGADWLALRAPADAAARADAVTALAARWLDARRSSRRPLHLADLGAGSGNNARFLAPRLPGPQRWQLIDHDAALLERACANGLESRAADGSPARFVPLTRALDDLRDDDLHGFDLVSASALIDLVSADWLSRFARALARSGAATLVALSVDGNWRFSDAGGDDVDPADAQVRAAFNAHQRRDKGMGGALGPDAVACLAGLLRARGYRVLQAPSPWRLRLGDGPQAELARAVLDGWRDAALEQTPAAADQIADWHARRVPRLAQAGLTLELGHTDLFACPADTWPAERP